MIKSWMESYGSRSLGESEQVFREIVQQIALAGLYRAAFFKSAAFGGGTALRIFHGLNRYSEDLDFSLLKPETDFDLTPFFNEVIEEFQSVGIRVSIHKKIKTIPTNIDAAVIKNDSEWGELIFEETVPQLDLKIKPRIKIKIETDKNPITNLQSENLLLLKPYSFYVRCLTLPELFAGKMHALLFRKWRSRVKGRDWYDAEWLIRAGIKMDFENFSKRGIASKDLTDLNFTIDHFKSLLNEKLSEVNFIEIKNDVSRFLIDQSGLDIWDQNYFKNLFEKIRFLKSDLKSE